MEIRKNYKYAVCCVTSMGVRITPENRMAVQNSNMFYMQATSAETNVLNVSSSLGKPCLALTKFVEGSPVASFIKAQLKERNIAYEGKEVYVYGVYRGQSAGKYVTLQVVGIEFVGEAPATETTFVKEKSVELQLGETAPTKKITIAKSVPK